MWSSSSKPGVRHMMALVAILAVVLCLYRLLDSVQTLVWDGDFPLLVDLEDRSGRQIISVSALPVRGIEEADYYLAHDRNQGLELVDVNWVDGQPFTVRVVYSGTVSMSGRELSYTQFRSLLVRVEYADGASQRCSVDIPDGRSRRRVSVLFP